MSPRRVHAQTAPHAAVHVRKLCIAVAWPTLILPSCSEKDRLDRKCIIPETIRSVPHRGPLARPLRLYTRPLRLHACVARSSPRSVTVRREIRWREQTDALPPKIGHRFYSPETAMRWYIQYSTKKVAKAPPLLNPFVVESVFRDLSPLRAGTVR